MSKIVTGGIVIENVLEHILGHSYARLIFRSNKFLYEHFRSLYENSQTLFLTSFDMSGDISWNGWARVHIMLLVGVEDITTERYLADGEIQLDLLFLPTRELSRLDVENWKREGF